MESFIKSITSVSVKDYNTARGFQHISNQIDIINYLRSHEYWDTLGQSFVTETFTGDTKVREDLVTSDLSHDVIKFGVNKDSKKFTIRFSRTANNFVRDFQLAGLESDFEGHQVAVFYFREGGEKYFSVVDSNGTTDVYDVKTKITYTTKDFISTLRNALGDGWRYKDLHFPKIQSCEITGNFTGGCVLWATLTVDMVAQGGGFESAIKEINLIERMSKSWAPGNRVLLSYDGIKFIGKYAVYLDTQIMTMERARYSNKEAEKVNSREFKTAQKLRRAIENLNAVLEKTSYNDAKMAKETGLASADDSTVTILEYKKNPYIRRSMDGIGIFIGLEVQYGWVIPKDPHTFCTSIM